MIYLKKPSIRRNAEISQHKEIMGPADTAGTKGLSRKMDVCHIRRIVKPASQPAPELFP